VGREGTVEPRCPTENYLMWPPIVSLPGWNDVFVGRDVDRTIPLGAFVTKSSSPLKSHEGVRNYRCTIVTRSRAFLQVPQPHYIHFGFSHWDEEADLMTAAPPPATTACWWNSRFFCCSVANYFLVSQVIFKVTWAVYVGFLHN